MYVCLKRNPPSQSHCTIIHTARAPLIKRLILISKSLTTLEQQKIKKTIATGNPLTNTHIHTVTVEVEVVMCYRITDVCITRASLHLESKTVMLSVSLEMTEPRFGTLGSPQANCRSPAYVVLWMLDFSIGMLLCWSTGSLTSLICVTSSFSQSQC